MNRLVWTSGFKRSAQKLIKKNPNIIKLFKLRIKILEDNPFHPSLKTHKLKGRLSSCFACSINFEYRIVFKICESESDCIELLNIGTHDEVY